MTTPLLQIYLTTIITILEELELEDIEVEDLEPLRCHGTASKKFYWTSLLNKSRQLVEKISRYSKYVWAIIPFNYLNNAIIGRRALEKQACV